jgi:hypothetical protein
MSKKKKNKIDGNFTIIEHRLINSEAFKNLNTYAKWLYIEFKLRFYGDNKNHIIFTQKEAKKIMAKDTFYKARAKLIERGFIDIVKRGGLENQPMIYGLSDRWKKFGTKDFIKVDLKKVLPKILKMKFKKGHKFMGNQFKKKEHL